MEVESKMAANFVEVLSAVFLEIHVPGREGKGRNRIYSSGVKKFILLLHNYSFIS